MPIATILVATVQLERYTMRKAATQTARMISTRHDDAAGEGDRCCVMIRMVTLHLMHGTDDCCRFAHYYVEVRD